MTLLADRYELGQELGAGGMARVVVAHDRVLGRDVAVKLLSPGADQPTRERFMREARSAARLHHPNAVAVYDTGEDAGQPYLVMELVRGRSLADLLRDEGTLEVEEAIGITVGVLDGLAAAHRSGMIHRDVKPANVLLPDEGGVKLSDFGIAKALDGTDVELTAAGSLMGTPTYLAPELVEGEPPSAASDVYGVGCLLYAQLTGDPPFTRGEALAIAYAHRNEPVPPVEDARPDLPPELVTVVGRALAKDPSERYDSATAMRRALLEGPDAVPAAAGATVALAGAGLGAGADRTQVLDGAEDEPTRVVGAPAAAPAAPDRGRRWWVPLLIALAVLVLGLLLWPLLTEGDVDAPAAPVDETDETEADEDEAEDEPEEPTSDDTPDDEPGPPEDPGPPDESPPDENPPEDDDGLVDELLEDDSASDGTSGEETATEDETVG